MQQLLDYLLETDIEIAYRGQPLPTAALAAAREDSESVRSHNAVAPRPGSGRCHNPGLPRMGLAPCAVAQPRGGSGRCPTLPPRLCATSSAAVSFSRRFRTKLSLMAHWPELHAAVRVRARAYSDEHDGVASPESNSKLGSSCSGGLAGSASRPWRRATSTRPRTRARQT